MRLRMFGATDQGLVRTANQDAYFCSAEYGLAIVSDGMGGHKGGERASQLTTDGLRDAFAAKSHRKIEDVSSHLDEVLQSINREILQIAEENENLKGMGATVNTLHILGNHVAIGHAGDSRTYLVRSYIKPDGKVRTGIWQLTIDHNVESFVARGLLIIGRDLPDGPLSERQKSRLTRGMGVVADLKADLYYRPIEDGDVYLTCTDGLHGYVSDQDILKAMTRGPLANSPERLIGLAKKAGAPDNVTVVVSVVSSIEEPLVKCKGPRLARSPFLAREPSGQISKLLSPEELVRQWMSFGVSNDAEICAASGPWVFLQQPAILFKTYPYFDRPEVKERLEHVVPQTDTSLEIHESTVNRRMPQAARSLVLSLRPKSRPTQIKNVRGTSTLWRNLAFGLALMTVVLSIWYLAVVTKRMMWMVY